MGVGRKDLFGDGSVYCDYFPGSRVELRVAGFKIVVYKPYAYKYWNSTQVCKNALISMSTNSTVFLTLADFELFKKSVQAGINILNMEGYNLITNDNIKYINSNDFIDASQNPYKDVVTPRIRQNSVKYGNQDSGLLITTKNLNKFLFLGKAVVKHRNCIINRSNCYYTYVQLPNSYTSDSNSCSVYNNTLELSVGDIWYGVDTYSGKKIAIDKVSLVPDGVLINKAVFKDSNGTPSIFELNYVN